MAVTDFKKGSSKELLMDSILKSALTTLIEADTYHNYVKSGSSAESPVFTDRGSSLYEKMQRGVRDVANTIGDAIAGETREDVDKSDGIFLFDEENETKYRVPFRTLAALLVAEAVQGDGEGSSIVTNTTLWTLLASNSDFQIDISHLRDALGGYLTRESMQGLFRSQGSDAYVSKIFDDEVLGMITFLAGLKTNGVAYLMNGLQIGLYQTGITGTGAKVDAFGNGEFESLIIRRFLEVPELRYNRVEILAGDSWRAPGGGVIESVTINEDGLTGRVTLKLEEGEPGNIEVDDICMGIFHDYTGSDENETNTTDDGFGNRTFAGFCTSYFRVTNVIDVTEVDGVKYYRKVFDYALRPTSARWNKTVHPHEFMSFVAYGNFTKTSRQNATYITPAYTRMLRGQNTWEFSFNNIGMQFGDCSILANFDTQSDPNPTAREASTYLFYIDGDIMHTGVLRQVDSHGRDIIDYYDQGPWESDKEYFYKDRVYHNGTLWLLVKEDDIDSSGVHHGVIGSEPTDGNPYWLAVVYSKTINSMGHWEATKTPYPSLSIVNLGGTLYISKKETSNPPRGLLTGKDGGVVKYIKDKNGMYIIAQEDGELSDDWDLLIDLNSNVQGQDAIYLNLTNDSDSIVTDENGVIPVGAEYPTTKGQLFRGGTQITEGITWRVTADGCTATIAPASGTVVTSNMTKDRAEVTVMATFNNMTYSKVFTFNKLFGADKYILEPSADVIGYDPNDGDGKFTPETLVVRAYAVKNGKRTEITSTSGLGHIKFNGNTYYSGMSVRTNSMSVFQQGRLRFELYDNSPTPKLADIEEVPLVQNGVNGTGVAIINLTNDTDSIVTDSNGNIAQDEEYPTTKAELYYQLQLVDSSEVEWNCIADGCSASIDEDGVVTTSNMTKDTATVTISAVFMGFEYTKKFVFKKLYGADKFYLHISHNTVVQEKTGRFTPSSLTVRAYVKRFGEDPVECTSSLNLAKIVYAGQQTPQFSPVNVVITNNSFTDRHIVFTLVSNGGDVLDTEDVPLVTDGRDGVDGQDGRDGRDLSIMGNWDPTVEYEPSNIVRMGNTLYSCLVANTNKPPHAILKDGVDGKYLTDENGRYILADTDEDSVNWTYYIRDGRDGIDGEDGKDGRDGQDGKTPVFINLTNDTDSVITDESGNPLGDLPSTTAQFFFGQTQLGYEDGVVWGTDHVVGCQVTWDNDGNYMITRMDSDRAQVIIKATYNGSFYLKTFSVSKLYGQDKYVLQPEYGTVQYNANTNTYSPSMLEVYAYVIKNGEYITLNESERLGYIEYEGIRGYNGLRIPTSQYFAEGGLEILLKDMDGNVRDKEYVPRVTDGKDGENGLDAAGVHFDDTSMHFICDSDGNQIAGQSYSTVGRLYYGLDSLQLDETASVATSSTVNFVLAFGGTGRKDAILTVSGFKAGAPDVNTVSVKLVSKDGRVTRTATINVDKVRPGADGITPTIYDVKPQATIIKKSANGTFTPSVLLVFVAKTYEEDGVIKRVMLTPSGASSEGITIYYGIDKLVSTIAAATGTVTDTGITPPSTLESYINFVIAKSDGVIIDTQNTGVIMDGETVIIADLDNESDTMLYDGNDNLVSGSCVTNGKLYKGLTDITSSATWRIKSKTNVTASISGSKVTVSAISANTGSVTISAKYDEVDYDTVFTVKKLKGVDKYEIITSSTSINYDPNTMSWLTGAVKVDVYRTAQNGSRTKLGSSGLPSGYSLSYTFGTTSRTINPGASIPVADFRTSGIVITLANGSAVVDVETLPALINGKDGRDGASITIDTENSSIMYAIGTSPTTPPASGWSTSIPAAQQGKFLWTRDITAYSDGTSTTTYGVTYSSTDGKSVQIDTSKTYVRYSTVKTAAQPADSTFTLTSPPPLAMGDYLWILSQTAYIGISTVLKSYSVSRLGTDGADGDDGADGFTTHFAYATSADGTSNFSTVNFPGATYIGTYRDNQAADSTNPASYVWTQWRGNDGEDGKSFQHMGHWNSYTDYKEGDYVNFAGGMYMCLSPCTGIPPLRCLTNNGQNYITDKNGMYIVCTPVYENTQYWSLDVPPVADTVRFDLDNENDSILYDGQGNKISDDPVSNATLYVNGEVYPGVVNVLASFTGCSGTVSGNQVTITDVTGNSGYAIVSTVHNGTTYRAKMSITRIEGTDKYDIVLSSGGVLVNPNTGSVTPETITVDVYRTAQNSGMEKLTSLPSGFKLYYNAGSKVQITPGGIIPKSVLSTASEVLVTLENGSVTVDSESVVVARDGRDGYRIDLDNENDSIIYDNLGNKVSANVVTHATVYKGTQKYTGTVSFTWTPSSCSGAASGTGNNTYTVSGITSGQNIASVTCKCTIEGVEYQKILSISRLVNTNKYEIILSASDVTYNPNTKVYAPESVTADVYKISQQNGREKLASNAFSSSTSPEYKFSLKYMKGDGTYTSINPGSSIPSSAWAAGDVRVILYNADTTPKELDAETVPVVKMGANGKDACRLDLDNENDTILYSKTGTVLSTATTQAFFYYGGSRITPDAGFTIGSISTGLKVVGSSGQTYTVGSVVSDGIVKVTEMTGDISTGQVEIVATHVGTRYSAVFSLKKLVGINKYEIIATPNAITYDTTLETVTNGSIRVEVWKTSGIDGKRENVKSLIGEDLVLTAEGFTVGYTASGYATVNVTAQKAASINSIQFVLKGKTDSTVIHDAETVPVNKVASSTRYFMEVGPNALVKTSGNTWVTTGSITVRVYKQKGDEAPIQAVQGDVFLWYQHSAAVGSMTINNGSASININSVPPTSNSVAVFLTKTSSSSGTRIASETIPVIANGAQGYEGCQTRTTKWEDTNDTDAYRVHFMNDRGTNKAFKVVDVIAVPWHDGIKTLDGNVVSRPSSGYLWYVCETEHWQEMTWELERTKHAAKWRAMSDPGPMFTSLLIAEYGRIEFGTTNEFVVVNSRDEVVAGITGGINTDDEEDSVRIWAGKSLPTETWTQTLPNYALAKYLWARIRIQYGATAAQATPRYILATMLCDPNLVYASVVVEYNLQDSGIDKAPVTGWQNVPYYTAPYGEDGQHVWVRLTAKNADEVTLATKYLRIRNKAQNIWGMSVEYTSSSRQGSEPSLASFRVTQSGEMFATNAHISGEVNATSGTFTNINVQSGRVGGFTITSNTIGSDADADGQNLFLSRSFVKIGGGNAYVLMGSNVAPGTAGGAFTMSGRIVNTKVNSSSAYGFDVANYGLYIDVSGGTKNYGIQSTAAIRGSAVYGDRVKTLDFSGNQQTYSIDLSQYNVYMLVPNAADIYVDLPNEASICKQFSYSSLPNDSAKGVYFGFHFLLIYPRNASGGSITIKNIYDRNGNLNNWKLTKGDSLDIFVSNYGGFHYQIINENN